MSRRVALGVDVFERSLERLVALYRDGHRLVVSFSGGKDSTIALEMCVIAARMTDRLPVDVVVRDEEILLPGTYEYVERVHKRSEIRMRWLVASQPVINVYNRQQPYFWVFDPLLPRSAWVRQPPAYAEPMGTINIDSMTVPDRFPPAAGKKLYSILGIRIEESRGRRYGLFSANGYITKPKRFGVASVWPIFDWSTGDVWKAIADHGWDYCSAYDMLTKMGVPRGKQRIAPPTMSTAGATELMIAAKSWPQWFDKVCERLPGVRQVSLFGLRCIQPYRRQGETWEDCFQRECIDDAPVWIRERAIKARDVVLSFHAHHSQAPLPEVTPCYNCVNNIGCWKSLTMDLYNGDAFGLKMHDILDPVEPEYFRAGSGTWNGKPSW